MPDEPIDYYGLLQVDPRAEVDVIQAAYRVLARKAHPDLTGDDGRMKLLNEAWHNLGDHGRRARYDRQRGTRAANQAAGRPTNESPTQKPPVVVGTPPEPTMSVDQDSAGPPPGKPWGSVLGFGRYHGWSLGEIGRVDREYLEWLQRAPVGIRFRVELDLLLRDG